MIDLGRPCILPSARRSGWGFGTARERNVTMHRSGFLSLLLALAPGAALAQTEPGMIERPDGLRYVDLKIGDGPLPRIGQTVTVTYTGTLVDGTVFDASSQHGGTFDFQFAMGDVIAGWDEGVATMRAGGSRKLIVPPSLAYGASGAGDAIPPNATLIFTIGLIKIT